jgi:hypothetical protein
MLQELIKLGISLAHEIKEAEDGWLLINRKN